MGVLMKLTEARKLFYELRAQGRISIGIHAERDHKERMFTKTEIIYLIQHTKGRLSENNKFPTSIKGSFFYECKDDFGRNVEAAVLIKDNIIVVHIFRRV